MVIKIRTAGLDEYLEGGEGKFNILLFGPPGGGKTPWAAQAPAPFFLMADRGGQNSLVMTKTPYVKIRSEADFDEAIAFLQMDQAGKNPQYKTVVLDTISVYAKHLQQDILRREGIPSMDDFRQWGELGQRTANALHKLQNLDMNVIVNCHVKDKFNSEELEPDLQGGARVDLPKEFPYIGLLQMTWDIQQIDGKDERVAVRKIRWRGTPKIPHLRSASNILPETTPVNFQPSDWTVLTDAVRAGAEAIGTRAEVTEVETPTEQTAVKAEDAVSGPVAPKPARRAPAKKAEAKKDDAPAAKKDEAPAEPTHDEAVANVQETLGGEVVSELNLVDQIKAATTAEEFHALWAQNKPQWGDEHTAAVKARKAELGL